MFVKQAANVLDLIEFFARLKRPATLSEIAQEFDWPRSSTFNLVGTLVERGYLYEPKPRAGIIRRRDGLRSAEEIAGAEPLPAWLHDLLLELAAMTGETVFITAAAGTSVVLLDVVESEADIRYFARVGKRIPIQATASGRAILAKYTPFERLSVLKKFKFESYQPSSPMSIDAVEAEIKRSIERGWFQGSTEFTPDVVGIALPVPLVDRRLSLCVGGPTFRLGPRIPELASGVRDTVQRYLAKASPARMV